MEADNYVKVENIKIYKITYIDNIGGIIETEKENIYYRTEKNNIRLVSSGEFYRFIKFHEWKSICTSHFKIYISPKLTQYELLELEKECQVIEDKLFALENYFAFKDITPCIKSNIYILSDYSETLDKLHNGYYEADYIDKFSLDITCLKNINYHEIIHLLFLVNGYNKKYCDLLVEGCAELNRCILYNEIPVEEYVVNNICSKDGNFINWNLTSYNYAFYICFNIIKYYGLDRLIKLYEEPNENFLNEMINTITGKQ